MCFPGVRIRVYYFPHPGKSGVMPIRRAAATPTPEKAPSAAAEKGEAGVVHLWNLRPEKAPPSRTQIELVSVLITDTHGSLQSGDGCVGMQSLLYNLSSRKQVSRPDN